MDHWYSELDCWFNKRNHRSNKTGCIISSSSCGSLKWWIWYLEGFFGDSYGFCVPDSILRNSWVRRYSKTLIRFVRPHISPRFPRPSGSDPSSSVWCSIRNRNSSFRSLFVNHSHQRKKCIRTKRMIKKKKKKTK